MTDENLSTSEARESALRAAVAERFACPFNQKAFLTGAQPAYLGAGQTPLGSAQRSESGYHTAISLLRPVSGC